jgi:chromosome segregation ATPase
MERLMATKAAQSQLAELPERVGILETKVQNTNEKLDDLKDDVKDMHDCLDQTRDCVMSQLNTMQTEYRGNSGKFFEHADKLHTEATAQSKELAAKISDLEKFKNKWMYMIMGGIAVFGFVSGHLNSLANLLK